MGKHGAAFGAADLSSDHKSIDATHCLTRVQFSYFDPNDNSDNCTINNSFIIPFIFTDIVVTIVRSINFTNRNLQWRPRS